MSSKIVKYAIKVNSTKTLEKLKRSHKKVKHIEHKSTSKPQKYLKSHIFTNQMKSTLFNLRSKCENEFKENFHHSSGNHICQFCEECADSQEHALSCTVLVKQMSNKHKKQILSVEYNDLFGNVFQLGGCTFITLDIQSQMM